jgi:cobalt-zinc-cadmium efflux system outer membrane protein
MVLLGSLGSDLASARPGRSGQAAGPAVPEGPPPVVRPGRPWRPPVGPSSRGPQAGEEELAGSLTLGGLFARAQERYPSLVAARQARRQAEFQAVVAGALPPVMLSAGAHVGRDATGDDEDLLLGGRLELGGKRRLRVAVARREVDAARQRERQALAELYFQVRAAYSDLQAAAAEEDLQRENVELAQTFLRLARLQFEVGDVPQTNVLRAEIEVENAEQDLTAARAVTQARQSVLNTLIGADPGAPVALPPLAALAAPGGDLEQLRERALRRPDLRAAEAVREARDAGVASARAARRPDLTGQAAHGKFYDWPDGNVFRLGLEFPVWDFGRTRATANAARAAADEQSANVRLLRLQAAQEVEIAYRNLAAASLQAERLGGPQLERIRRLRDLAELGYREGQFSYLELLDAQRAYLATSTQYLRAVAAANTASAALARAIGVAGPEELGGPGPDGEAYEKPDRIAPPSP